ncbi:MULTISPECIES: helix-turn-helix domain-containing protein [Pandoraea]|uniref:winged helix-turn-helix transcriptional regulator n=1 Tax=Pandoraea TaxID=93217 RepID=UPI001F5C50B5|nr:MULTISPECIES: helix-turn-helix domain-containing protein [Pandoraea]MCI3205968.1 transcriptional regulator [Pandoraea sp. LA3]MDN4583996.1 transcriptional regulator [Pandoraea capi]
MKGKKTDLSQVECGIARALGVIGDWWSLLIVRDAMRGMTRFGEFQTNLGLARNILSTRLKKLVEDGILDITPDPDGSVYKIYVLTPRGRALGTVLVALWQWGETYCFDDDELSLTLVDRASGTPLAPIALTTVDGQPVAPDGYMSAPRPKRRATRKATQRASA